MGKLHRMTWRTNLQHISKEWNKMQQLQYTTQATATPKINRISTKRKYIDRLYNK